jgi:VanZ family protein
MSKPRPAAKMWPVAVIMLAGIVYGSLYPFEFRVPAHGIGPLATFVQSWNERPGRGDFIANVLLYMPLGFFFLLSFPETRRRAMLPLAVLCGALLSLSMELTQYYDADRVTSASDFYTNTIGTFVGGLGAGAMGARFRLPYIGEVSARPIPTMLMFAWLGRDLYPYVPTIDLHKYWNALKPIVLTPSLHELDLFRETAIWLTVFTLIEALLGKWQSALLALPFAAAVLFAKILIVDKMLGVADVVGIGVAFAGWLALMILRDRPRALIVGLVLSAYVIVQQLEPFEFQSVARGFRWQPFYGFMHGSLQLDMLAFFEKFFLYGSMVYLLGRATRWPLAAALIVAALLFATSWAETYQPARSGEITDTFMALVIAAVFALLPSGEEKQSAGPVTAEQRRLRDWQRAQARAMGVKIDQ